MNGWRLLGRAILVGVDALAAGAIVALGVFVLLPIVFVSDRIELALVSGGVVTGVTLAVALALARRGRRPFPATRLAKRAVDRFPPWWP